MDASMRIASSPSAGRHNSDGYSNLNDGLGVHSDKHSQLIDRSCPESCSNHEKTRTKPGQKESLCLYLEVFEERLCSEHQPLTRDQVEALDMDLLGQSLDRQDAHARAHLVVPTVDQRIFFACKLVELLKCG